MSKQVMTLPPETKHLSFCPMTHILWIHNLWYRAIQWNVIDVPPGSSWGRHRQRGRAICGALGQEPCSGVRSPRRSTTVRGWILMEKVSVSVVELNWLIPVSWISNNFDNRLINLQSKMHKIAEFPLFMWEFLLLLVFSCCSDKTTNLSRSA